MKKGYAEEKKKMDEQRRVLNEEINLFNQKKAMDDAAHLVSHTLPAKGKKKWRGVGLVMGG